MDEVFNVWLPDWSRRWIISVDMDKSNAMDNFYNKAAEAHLRCNRRIQGKHGGCTPIFGVFM